jgi:hypothetical protein
MRFALAARSTASASAMAWGGRMSARGAGTEDRARLAPAWESGAACETGRCHAVGRSAAAELRRSRRRARGERGAG